MEGEDASTRAVAFAPRFGAMEVKARGIALVGRQASAEANEESTSRRSRRLRRKQLAETAVAHWKFFAREGIAEARARAHAALAPRRRALARWRTAATALRLRRVADAGRRRFLAESRGLAAWAAWTRAARERRRLRRAEAAAAMMENAAATAIRTPWGRAGASRAVRLWKAEAESRRALRAGERAARALSARTRATCALHRWSGAVAVSVARRGVEEAALRAWAAVRLTRGMMALRRHVLRRRLSAFLHRRAATARRRLLGRRGFGALDAALLRSAGERDVAAEVEAGRARAALARWRRHTETRKMRRAALAEQSLTHASLLLQERGNRALRQWRRFCSNRRHFRALVDDLATVNRHHHQTHSIPPPPTASSSPTPISKGGRKKLAEASALRSRPGAMRGRQPRGGAAAAVFGDDNNIASATVLSIASSRLKPMLAGKSDTNIFRRRGHRRCSSLSSSPPPPPPPPIPREHVSTRRLSGDEAADDHRGGIVVRRARAVASFRLWHRGFNKRRERREASGLASGFRDHVLLLRHHESWKAFARRGKEAAVVAAAATALGRRVRMRRALLGLVRAVEVCQEEREEARPCLREALGAWSSFVRARDQKKLRLAEEDMERGRTSARLMLQVWSRRNRVAVYGRNLLEEGGRWYRARCLRRALGAWERASRDSCRSRERAENSREHARRRRLSTGVMVWRAAAASNVLRRAASEAARGKACRSLTLRTMRAWRERADLQAARKAVFRARVASATRTLAEGKLRRSLGRWQEVHSSARVAAITRLRAEGHARRKILGRFWRSWVSARVLQRRRRAFWEEVKARQSLALQRTAFTAMVTAAATAKRERERVSAALRLWKLHTQGKAFAALAAHRIRRRWKQDRARRAVGWRRERLIKDGALRWAASADALAAGRISSAACREATAAARRWKAAGRCARHWRRITAARAMERRAREGTARGGHPVVIGSSGRTTPAVMPSATTGWVSAESRGLDGGLSRQHRQKHGCTEGCSGGGWGDGREEYAGAYGRYSISVSVPPTSAAVAPRFCSVGRALAGVSIPHRPQSTAGSLELNGASAKAGALVGPARCWTAAASDATAVVDVLSGPPGGPVSKSVCGRLVGGGLHVAHSDSSRPRQRVESRADVSSVGAVANRAEPWLSLGSTAAASAAAAGGGRVEITMPAGGNEVDRSPSLPSLPRGRDGQTASGNSARRPAPRRPLELLLDENPGRVAATSAGGSHRSGAWPLSAWVVDEMNRRFGTRSYGTGGPVRGEHRLGAPRRGDGGDVGSQGGRFTGDGGMDDGGGCGGGEWVSEGLSARAGSGLSARGGGGNGAAARSTSDARLVGGVMYNSGGSCDGGRDGRTSRVRHVQLYENAARQFRGDDDGGGGAANGVHDRPVTAAWGDGGRGHGESGRLHAEATTSLSSIVTNPPRQPPNSTHNGARSESREDGVRDTSNAQRVTVAAGQQRSSDEGPPRRAPSIPNAARYPRLACAAGSNPGFGGDATDAATKTRGAEDLTSEDCVNVPRHSDVSSSAAEADTTSEGLVDGDPVAQRGEPSRSGRRIAVGSSCFAGVYEHPRDAPVVGSIPLQSSLVTVPLTCPESQRGLGGPESAPLTSRGFVGAPPGGVPLFPSTERRTPRGRSRGDGGTGGGSGLEADSGAERLESSKPGAPPAPSPPSPPTPLAEQNPPLNEEQILEARVAEAEERLRELQEKSRIRRRDKRELAELHRALAAVEETQRGPRSPPPPPPSPPMSVPLPSSRENGQPSLVSMVDKSSSSSSSSSSSGGGGFGSNGDGGFLRGALGRGGSASLSSTATGAVEDGGDDARVGSTLIDAGALTSITNASNACSERDSRGENALRDEEAPIGSHVAGMGDPGIVGGGGGGGVIAAGLGNDPRSTASRAGLLVRMGLLRARLDRSRAKGDEGVRPVAEMLWRDVEDLTGGSGSENVAFRFSGD